MFPLAKHGQLRFDLFAGTLVGEVALRRESDLLDLVAQQTCRPLDEIVADYGKCLFEARQQLIVERRDPTPNRLG